MTEPRRKLPPDPRETKLARKRIVGVDGEGHDVKEGFHTCASGEPCTDQCTGKVRHIYTYLAAVDENGVVVGEAYNPNGLSHIECVDMLLQLPVDSLKFGFMFSYDVTKILEDLPEAIIYLLLRPQEREVRVCADRECRTIHEADAKDEFCQECGNLELRKTSEPISYENHLYDFFNGSLTITRKTRTRRSWTTKVWDCFRFFGEAFVSALVKWKVGTDEQVARIRAMKAQRGSFDVVDPEEVKGYCREECHLLAIMMRKVIQAHDDAGIPLSRYDGAGSTASSLLKVNNVAEFKGPRHRDLDPRLGRAAACAFFGGRFEDSVVGILPHECHGFDISSAYPFALTMIPCLACGRWERVANPTEDDLRSGQIAISSFRVRQVSASARMDLAWCPLPFRDQKGSISYGTNFSGWAWGPEILSALRGWPDLVELGPEAWIYRTDCDHRPFGFMPANYRRRVLWGKEGAGIVMKLGMNASYGKTAQSIGDDPPFQSWIWAGLCTATTRSQMLDAIQLAEDRWNVYAIATDGIYASEVLPIKAPPWGTGTDDMEKPLGGWEHKAVPEGMFVAKPGLYWRLGSSATDIRARGLGRREAHENMRRLEEGFLEWDRVDPRHGVVVNSRRFYGGKHSILSFAGCDRPGCRTSWPGTVNTRRCRTCGRNGTRFTTKKVVNARGHAAYGTWDLRTVKIAFDPSPKRQREGLSKSGTFSRLYVRDLEGLESAPYDVGPQLIEDPSDLSPEAVAAINAEAFELEQPDWYA